MMIFIFCIRSLLGLPGAGVVVEARQVGGLEALLEGEAMNLKMLLWAEVVGLEFGVVEEVEVEVQLLRRVPRELAVHPLVRLHRELAICS